MNMLGSLAKHRAFLGLPCKKGSVVPFPCDPAKIYKLQVEGLARRLKAIHCRDVVIGLSGGLDSTLALLVCVGAFKKLRLDKRGIHVYTMPGFGTSRRTKGNALVLCEGLGLTVETISIVKSVKQHLKDIGHDGKTPDVTYENAQARMRTLILMDKANMTNGIVIGTGDLSEIALGWCTYNGDHMAMFAVNNDIPKTVVRKICRWWADTHRSARALTRNRTASASTARALTRNRTASASTARALTRNRTASDLASDAILDILATPVSPELVKGQVTEDKIGPYELHDFFLWNFIMNEMGSRDLLAAAEKYFLSPTLTANSQQLTALAKSYSKKMIADTLSVFLRRFFTQAFKRNCQPDGIKVFPFELSLHGWWIPSDLGVVKI